MSILSKASLVQIPSGYGEDKLYSQVPNTTTGDFTFTRASTGTRVNADGYIEEVPWNLVTNSNDLSYLSTSNVTKTTNAITSPIGSNDGISVVNTNNYGNLFKTNVTIKKDSNFTQSVYVKPFSTSFIYMRALSFDNDMFCWFDLENVSVGTDAYNIGSIEQAEDGWVRCSITFTSTTNLTGRLYLYATSADNQIAQTGDSVYYWGLQYNHGSPKPYIKTTNRLDVPRLDYSGGASCPTLLLEPQRTNLIPYSQDFTSGWVGSVTPNSATSPDGTTNATLLADGSNIYYPFNSGTAALTLTLYAKSTDSELVLRMRTNTNVNCDVYFDLVNGVIISTTGNTWTNVVSSMEVLGDYYRCRLTATPPSGSFNNQVRIFALNGTSGCYIWGCQLEQGNYTTSYIPTNGTSVTRVADVSETSGLSDYIGQSEGSFIIDFKCPAGGGGQIYIWNGTIQERLVINIRETNTRIDALAVVGNSLVANENLFDQDTTQRTIYGIRYRENDFEIWVNGVLKATETGTFSFWSAGTLDQFDFNSYDNTAKFVGNVNKVIFTTTYPTDEEMQQLTTI